jgi:hypothetical protein
MIRRRIIQAAIAVLPLFGFASVAAAQHAVAAGPHAAPAGQHAAPSGPLTMDQLHQMLQDIPGAEYETANRLKNEALHAVMMGADASVYEAKLKAFAQEFAKVQGADPNAMEAHVREVGAQLSALAKDPNFQAHMAQLHASH